MLQICSIFSEHLFLRTPLKGRRNFSFVARYSLKFTCCSLLVLKSLVTRCKIRSLLVAEVACCKKSLVTHCKIRSLLVAEVARCKKSLVIEVVPCEKSLVVRCKNSLVTRCKIRSLLVAEVARCKKSLVIEVARCKKSLAARWKNSIVTYFVKLLSRANFS